ncbi:DUF3040 domain-containing protein [Arthrobacter sp. TmT3-37]
MYSSGGQGRQMSLSDDERRAWSELERSLVDDYPGAPNRLQHRSWMPSQAARRRVLSQLILVVGGVVFIAGALMLAPLLWITGIGVLCVGALRSDRRARGRRSSGSHERDRDQLGEL